MKMDETKDNGKISVFEQFEPAKPKNFGQLHRAAASDHRRSLRQCKIEDVKGHRSLLVSGSGRGGLPTLIAPNASTTIGRELRILHMKHANALVVNINEVKVVQLLQDEVAGL